MTPLYGRRYGLVGLWMLVLIAFHMPWTTHPTAAFRLNAFDLAEQIRYHPAIIAESPTLRSSALLWAGLAMIAGGLAMTSRLFRDWRAHWGWWGLACLIALRMIPNQDAIRNPRLMLEDDYSRIFALLMGFGLALAIVAVILPRPKITLPVLASLALILPIIGFMRGWRLLDELGLDLGLGAGMMIYSAATLGIMILTLWPQKTNSPKQIVRAAA